MGPNDVAVEGLLLLVQVPHAGFCEPREKRVDYVPDEMWGNDIADLNAGSPGHTAHCPPAGGG